MKNMVNNLLGFCRLSHAFKVCKKVMMLIALIIIGFGLTACFRCTGSLLSCPGGL